MTTIDIINPPNIPQPKWRWKDLVLILLGSGAILAVGVFLISLIFQEGRFDPQAALQPTIGLSLGLAALESIALIGGVYLFGLKRKHYDWAEVGLIPASQTWLIIAVLATSVAIPLTGLITILVLLALGLPMENPQLDFLLPEGISTLQAFGMFLLAGIAAPFAEELFFRGILYTMFRERWGIWPGVLLSSLIFALAHGNIAIGVTAFLLGILLAVIYEYSKSLWTAVLIHALNNSAKIALLYLLIRLGVSAAP